MISHPDQSKLQAESLKILLLPNPTLNNPKSLPYQALLQACQALLKYIFAGKLRTLIQNTNQKIVYTHETGDRVLKIWNGSGIRIGSDAMRYACRKKDIIMVVRSSSEEDHKLAPQPEQKVQHNNFLTLPNPSPFNNLNQTHQDNLINSPNTRNPLYIKSMIPDFEPTYPIYNESQISQIIRKINKECIISFVYIDNNGFASFRKEKDIQVQAKEAKRKRKEKEIPEVDFREIAGSSTVMVIPKIEREPEEYQVIVSGGGSHMSSKSTADSQLIVRIVDDISCYFCARSSSRLSSRLTKSMTEGSPTRISSPLRKRHTNPYPPQQITQKSKEKKAKKSFFSCCPSSRRSINTSIRLISIKNLEPKIGDFGKIQKVNTSYEKIA